MIGVKIGSEFLDIAKGNNISFELNSSLFDGNNFEGNFTYPFTPALSPKNIRLLGHRLNPQSTTSLNDPIEVFIYVGGNPYKKGLLRITSVTSKISAIIQIDNSTIADKLKKVKLKDIPMGDSRFLGNTVAEKIAHFNATAPILPFLPFDYIFFPTYNPIFYKEETESANPDFNTTAKGVLNVFNGGTFIGNSDIIGVGQEKAYSFVPYPSFTYVLRKVCEYLGFGVTGDVFTSDTWKRAVIYNTVAIDKFVTSGAWTANVYQNTLDIQNHLPDITIEEFLGSLRTGIFLDHYIDTTRNIIDFKFIKQILNDPNVVDWSKNCNRKFEYKEADKKGAKLTFGVDDNDELFEEYKFTREIIEGDGENAISSDLGLVYTEKDFTPSLTYQIKAAAAKQVGNSLDNFYNNAEDDVHYLGENKFSFRLMFYHGRQENSLGQLTPFGSSDVYNYTDDVVGSQSMKYFGTYGRRNTLALEYLDFLDKTKPLVFSKRFTDAELLNFHPHKKVIINGIKGLVKQIKFNSDYRYKEAQFTLYTV